MKPINYCHCKFNKFTRSFDEETGRCTYCGLIVEGG